MTADILNMIKDDGNRPERMPVFFVGHGSPMNAIEVNEFSRSWQEIGRSIPRPRAILCISAHWETRGTFVTAMPEPRTIHDFGGFPRDLYEVQYPAPGDPELAAFISKNTKTGNVVPGAAREDAYSKTTPGANGPGTVGLDTSWGLDHGSWSVIRHIYPGADVPVLELSLDYRLKPEQHVELARELAFLRSRGVLIIGSGNIVHNLGLIAWDHAADSGFGFDWALEANDLFKTLIVSGDTSRLSQYENLGRAAKLAVPSPDHFLPMLYILGLRNENEPVSFFNDKAVMGSLTMTSFRVG
jgi:4,5-DOPA dioxygenase extradiol